jgi:hypothetical protein
MLEEAKINGSFVNNNEEFFYGKNGWFVAAGSSDIYNYFAKDIWNYLSLFSLRTVHFI